MSAKEIYLIALCASWLAIGIVAHFVVVRPRERGKK